MKVEERVAAFSTLGAYLSQISDEQFQTIAAGASMENPWFTKDNVRMALRGIASMLKPPGLLEWTSRYADNGHNRMVALVMAGNIPLVGFHDLLCVLVSGHSAQIKLSSKDSFLSRFIIRKLVEIEPRFEDHIHIVERLENFDAVIATGSDNSSRYFHQYFGKYANIIRKNRTSIGILDGTESEEELQELGTDLFSYFGLGCRNVSKLLVSRNFSVERFFPPLEVYQNIINHHKYVNNYDYQKSILLVNLVPFFDNGFLILQENEKTVSPISVVYFEYYDDDSQLAEKLSAVADKTQCIVGKHALANVAFGQAQYPSVDDYADGVDTMKFLSELH